MTKETILNQYDSSKSKLDEQASSLESLIKQLISSSNLNVHSVNARVKDRNSLIKKIDKKDKYETLSEITDIIGVRIITHYEDEVDQIAEIIKDEFTIDQENSIDKREVLDPDRFGYLSLHYIVSMTKTRSQFKEYKSFKGLKFEIQIRSILQHAWAEIEHDIGYKSENEIPRHIRRSFSRLAGLLELADQEFINIRENLDSYTVSVKDTISNSPEQVDIDAISLEEYISSNPEIAQMDNKIVSLLGVNLTPIDRESVARHLRYLNFFGIKTISQLQKEFQANKGLVFKRAEDIKKDGTIDQDLNPGISLFYLHQIKASQLESVDKIRNFLLANALATSQLEEFSAYLFNFNTVTLKIYGDTIGTPDGIKIFFLKEISPIQQGGVLANAFKGRCIKRDKNLEVYKCLP